MSLITAHYPSSGNVFSRNPFIVSINSATLAQYTLTVGGTVVFTGNGIGAFDIDLSDILEGLFTESSPVAGSTLLLAYQANVNWFDAVFSVSAENVQTETISFRAWKGGISKRDFRILRQQSTDVFADKLTNYGGNFFFTSRTYGWNIVMKETEIEPLAFIMPQQGSIVIREMLTQETVTVSGTAGELVALNIDAVRKEFFETYGIIANAFEVLNPNYTDSIACRIVIEKAIESVERCAVTFLNSFGVYERIDLVGETTVQLVPTQNENSIYQAYDPDTDSFVNERQRTPMGTTYKVKTGIKRTDELTFIQDMLTSDHVYLILPDGQEVKVIPTVEQGSRAYVQRAPESMDITFQPVEQESNFTPLRSVTGSGRPRYFASVFSQQFN